MRYLILLLSISFSLGAYAQQPTLKTWKAEAKKDEFDAAMNKKYGVRANLDYLLEITSVSLFLVLDKSDLSDIAKKQEHTVHF